MQANLFEHEFKQAMALLTMLLVAVGMPAHSAQPDFLTQLGVDVSNVRVINTGNRFDFEDITESAMLESNQVIALLDDAIHQQYAIDNDIAEGLISIVALCPMPDERMVIVFSHEYGDGAQNSLGVYDRLGRLTDYVDLGYGHDWDGYNIDDDPKSEADVRSNTQLMVEAPEHLVVERTDQHNLWTDGDPMRPEEIGQRITTFHYLLDDQGHLQLTSIDKRDTGRLIDKHYSFVDLDNLKMSPMNDATLLDRLNTLLERDDVRADIARGEADEDYYSDAADKASLLVGGFFYNNPQQFFAWMAAHRDPAQNHLNSVMRDNMLSYRDDPSFVVQQATLIADPDTRNYIQQLIQYWVPKE